MSLKSILAYPFAYFVKLSNDRWIKNPLKFQKKTFHKLIEKAKKTTFGIDHGFENIKTYEDWKKNVPIRDYEGLKEYVDLVVDGKKDVLWPGKPQYFCKTSGTTSGTKYIPLTKEALPFHIKAARDAILSFIYETKKTAVVNGKMIFLQGSPELENINGVLTGRLSGITAHHIPKYLQKNRLPSLTTNCIENWEDKVDAIVDETINQPMSIIGGIPPWVQMYFERLSKKSNKKIKDLFSNFSLYIYGGVNYEPYRESIESIIGEKVPSVELFPASEGFIAYQNSQKDDGLLLCVNHGVFYEFVEANTFFDKKPKRVSLDDVSLNVNYVLILNTNSGLWGYNIGDTVMFVSLTPYKLIVTGRIKHFTSAFGEHVIGSEVEGALSEASKIYSCRVTEFHVAPVVAPKEGGPHHEWLIEFDKEPESLINFANEIDKNMQKINSYYFDLIKGGVLDSLKIRVIEKGGFVQHMKSIGKLGGQNKVPRLANDRVIANNLLNYEKKG